ncbi:putative ribonuclease H-like domain-containing protein [Tanacetum coccineum]
MITRNPMNPDIRTIVEYQKASLASLDVSALDKPHFKLENLLRRFIHKSNPKHADDRITTSFQLRQTHDHMLILKLQRYTISIKDSRKQESLKHIKTKTMKLNKERNDCSNGSLLAFKMMQSMHMSIRSTRKGRACVYFNFPFAIKLAIGLNIFPHDPSTLGRISLLVSLLNSFHQKRLLNSEKISRCSNNIKKGEYDIWAMKMEHYLAHTDYPIWEVIQNGNGPVSITTDTQGQIKVLPPRTAEEILARERERKARTTLLMALLEDHLAKFHKMTDAKEMWEAIRSRFRGNDESKKMQKYILKQQFEGFFVSNSEGLHKGYDRSLPSAWSQVSLIMRTKPEVDSLSFDDLYNNQKVFENDVKSSTASSSSTQNVAFVSENTSSTNNVSTAYGVSNPSDLEQLDEFDLEEMDLKWQVAMISIRMKKFYKKTGRKLEFDAKEPVGFDKTKVECYNCHKTGHFARECRTKGNQDSKRIDAWNSRNKDGRRSGKQEDSKALVTIDGEGVDWTSHSEEEEDYALMAFNSQLSDASIEILSYTQALKKVEAQLSSSSTKSIFGHDVKDKYESDSEDEHVSQPTEEQETPSFANQQATKHVIKYCGSLSHLIRDCDFHEKRMAKQVELNKQKGKGSSQREIRPVWNNVQKVNHKNQFVPTPVLTRIGKIPVSTARASGTNNVSTARYNFNSQAVLTNAARKISIVKPFMNRVRPKSVFHKTHSPFRRPFNNTTTLRTNFLKQKVNTAEVNAVSAVGGRRETAVKPSTGCNWRPKRHYSPQSSLQLPWCEQYLEIMLHSKDPLSDSSPTAWVLRDQISLYNGIIIHTDLSEQRDGLISGMFQAHDWKQGPTFMQNIKTLNGVPDAFVENIPISFSIPDLVTKKNKFFLLTLKCLVLSHEIKLPDAKPSLDLESPDKAIWKGPTWLFDLDYLTDSMNYQPVSSEDQANKHAGLKEANHNVGTPDINDVGDSEKEDESAQDYFVLPIWSSYSSTVKRSNVKDAGAAKTNSTNIVNTASILVSTAIPYGDLTNPDQDDSEIPALEEIYANPTDGIFTNSSYDDEGAVADFTNLEPVVNVSPIPTSRINSIHPSTLILGDPQSAVQTRSKVTKSQEPAYLLLVKYIQKQRRNNHKDFQHYLPYGKKAIRTKWVYKNKKDERGVVVRNKARLVAQGHRQEEGIDYDEVFALVAKIEAIRIFLAFDSYMGFIVYQMDVKSTFLYGKIDEEVYVSQPPGFIDPKYPKKVYKVVKALYGLHQAPRAWYATLSTFLLKNGYRRGTIDKTLFIKKDKHDIILVQVYVDDIIFGSTKKSWCDEFEALMKSRFQMSSMGELTFFLGLQVKQKEDGIFISQDKYVAEILKKFDFVSVKTASTPIETQKPLVKDEEASDVDVHLYRSMIGSLMYLTASRPDIMFAVCACSRFQVTPKTSHLSAVKRIFRYLKGKPKLGLWYPRVSSFDLEAYTDSDYAGANLDRKSTTGEAEYVAAANCCGKVLWIQNQMLDYRFNFMNTKIYIDNESTICIVKNPVYHSKTKHNAIRHHFIRDAYEKKLIQVLKIHTDDNVADLLTKAFDVSRESLGRALDGTEALLLPKLFILRLAKVSTDSAKLIPLGKDSTAIETLKKIPPRV